MSSKVDDALSIFGGKGKGSSGAPTSKKERQLEQQRKASARDRRLLKSPVHVVQKWNDILNLKGRDRSKNMQKAKFTEVIIADTNFSDTYWTTSVSDEYNKSKRLQGKWVHRSVADTAHGPGEIGKNVVQQMIDTGYYSSRTVKCTDKDGKQHDVEEVQIHAEKDEQGHTRSIQQKARAGGCSSKDEVAGAITGTMELMLEDTIVQKKPATANKGDVLAIMDEDGEYEEDEDGHPDDGKPKKNECQNQARSQQQR